MSWTNLTKPSVGDPTTKELADAMIDNFTFLYNQFLSVVGTREVVLNGSFEADADADGYPDGWTRTLYTGGSFTYRESVATADGLAFHGKRSISFTSPGGASNGGGYITSESFIEVTEGRAYKVQWSTKSTAADVHNQVQILWYDSTQTIISTVTIHEDYAENPSAWTIFEETVFPPANARYAKLRFHGCVDDDTTAGTTYYDDIRLSRYDFPREVQYTVAGTYKWKCPNDCEYIHVIAIGAGGGGGGASANAAAGGGGGGMAIGTLAVTAGTVYDIVVGAGGAGGSVVPAAGSAGTASTFSTISGGGGGGGAITSGAGGTGGTASGGTVNKTGNAGSARIDADNGGDGGASLWSGNVGIGGVLSGPGTPGDGHDYGAGGGGPGSGSNVGGAGADGTVIIRF